MERTGVDEVDGFCLVKVPIDFHFRITKKMHWYVGTSDVITDLGGISAAVDHILTTLGLLLVLDFFLRLVKLTQKHIQVDSSKY